MESTLQTRIISALPYEKLKSLCFTGKTEKEKQLRGALDCSWDVWRDRAREELGIPYSYFDLARKFPLPRLNGLERYLSLLSYFKLSELATVKVYSNGKTEGVYESLAGAEEALKRDSLPGLDIFLPRLTPLAKRTLLAEIKDEKLRPVEIAALAFFGEDVSELSPKKVTLYERVRRGEESAFFQAQKKFEGEISLLAAAVASGKIAFVQALLPQYYPELSNFSIEKEVPPLPYDEVLSFPLNLPPRPVDYIILNAAVFSCNPRLLDFFISLYQTAPTYLSFLARGYRFHRAPLGAYSNLLRFHLPEVFDPESIWETGNLEMIYYLLESFDPREREREERKILKSNLGNIPLVITLPLPTLDIVTIANIRKRYPLTARILEEEG